MFWPPGVAVVQAQIDEAAPDQIGKVALRCSPANTELLGYLDGRDIHCGLPYLYQHLRQGGRGAPRPPRRRPAQEAVQRVDGLLVGYRDFVEPLAEPLVRGELLAQLDESERLD